MAITAGCRHTGNEDRFFVHFLCLSPCYTMCPWIDSHTPALYFVRSSGLLSPSRDS